MDTESFSTTKLTKDRLDLWIKIGYNVMLIGEKGTGKSSQIIDAFNRNNLKWIYFSGATLDPWTDVVGIPKPKTLDTGETVIEYIRPQNMNEDVEAIFVDEYNRCFTGDTMIQSPDGNSYKIQDLVDKPYFYVYSYDIGRNKVVIGKAHSCRKTGKRKTLKITLDNGQKINCTEDHLFLTIEKKYVMAKDLKVNQSLMALYKKYNLKGYEYVLASRGKTAWTPTYHLADEYNLENNIYDYLPGSDIHRHHLDYNKYNNIPENIIQLYRLDHLKLHQHNDNNLSSKGGKNAHEKHPDLYDRTLNIIENRKKAAKLSEYTRKTNKEYKLLRSELSKNYWKDKKEFLKEKARRQWEDGKFSKINRKDALKKTHITKTINIIKEYINSENPLTLEYYRELQKKSTKSILKIKTLQKYFGSFDNFINHYHTTINEKITLNHRIISIETNNEEQDVYDFTVDNYHNFALGSGVFVHNCHKKVKNALMELIQFKSINGKKFNNLRFIWAAINPEDEESNYDVEPVDPAQLDRFHIIVNVPYKPDKDYFNKKYVKPTGSQAVKWWELQPENVKKLVSPRRLDYAVEAYLAGIDVGDVLPRIANIKKFKEMIVMNENEVSFETAYVAGDIELIKKMLTDDNIFEEIKNYVLVNDKYFINISNVCHIEKLSALYENTFLFKDWVDKNIDVGQNRKLLEEKGIIAKKNQPDLSMNSLLNSFSNITRDDRHEIKETVKYCKEFVNYAVSHKPSLPDRQNSFILKFKPKWKEFLRVSKEDNKMVILPDEVLAIVDYLDSVILASSDYKLAVKQIISIICHKKSIFGVESINGFLKIISENDDYSRLIRYYPKLYRPINQLCGSATNDTSINTIMLCL